MDRLKLSVSDDMTEGIITLNIPSDELKMDNRQTLTREIILFLKENKISFGIEKDFFQMELKNDIPYLIVKGIKPIDGIDSTISMYKIEPPIPTLNDDGSADMYDLNLINLVKAGDWLGERIEAIPGTPGISVYNKPIPPKPGKTLPLLFDRKSVQEILLNDKTTLFSKTPGAVFYDDEEITVCNHLFLDGNVNPSTGNIKFDGFVTIDGTIEDGFSVEATKDISISSPLGLSHIKGLKSTEGNIYIKGGINSKSIIDIHCKKNFYCKFVDNVNLICEGNVNIGYYCKDSVITGKSIILESKKSVICNCKITANINIKTSIVGTKSEKTTHLEVKGFNRTELLSEINALKNKIESSNEKLDTIKNTIQNSKQNPKNLSALIEKKYIIDKNIKHFENEKKDLQYALSIKGDGEINISSEIFPTAILKIKERFITKTKKSSGLILYYSKNELVEL